MRCGGKRVRGTSCAAFILGDRQDRPMLSFHYWHISFHPGISNRLSPSDSYRSATTATLRYRLTAGPDFSVEFVRRLFGSSSSKISDHQKTHQRGGDAREGGGGSADAHGWEACERIVTKQQQHAKVSEANPAGRKEGTAVDSIGYESHYQRILKNKQVE